MSNKEQVHRSSERFVRGFAGVVILASLLLGWSVSAYFYLVTAFAGFNLLQSSVTGFCPPQILYKKMAKRS